MENKSATAVSNFNNNGLETESPRHICPNATVLRDRSPTNHHHRLQTTAARVCPRVVTAAREPTDNLWQQRTSLLLLYVFFVFFVKFFCRPSTPHKSSRPLVHQLTTKRTHHMSTTTTNTRHFWHMRDVGWYVNAGL